MCARLTVLHVILRSWHLDLCYHLLFMRNFVFEYCAISFTLCNFFHYFDFIIFSCYLPSIYFNFFRRGTFSHFFILHYFFSILTNIYNFQFYFPFSFFSFFFYFIYCFFYFFFFSSFTGCWSHSQ